MLERDVERKLKVLEGFGFSVLKLITPGSNGTMDRMILRPKWSPGHPVVVEVKQDGERPRALQASKAKDWIARGVDVRPYVDSPAAITNLCDQLLREAVVKFLKADCDFQDLPPHIQRAFHAL